MLFKEGLTHNFKTENIQGVSVLAEAEAGPLSSVFSASPWPCHPGLTTPVHTHTHTQTHTHRDTHTDTHTHRHTHTQTHTLTHTLTLIHSHSLTHSHLSEKPWTRVTYPSQFAQDFSV